MVWLNQLEEHIQDKTPRETLVLSLPTLKKAAAFSADASTDAIKLSATLANSARWALWIKNWSGDIGSKNRLCSIPCEGEFLFGSVLDDLLEKAGDKEKGSPSNYPGRQSRFFRGSGGSSQNRKCRQEGNRFSGSKKSRGFLFNQPSGSFRRSGPQWQQTSVRGKTAKVFSSLGKDIWQSVDLGSNKNRSEVRFLQSSPYLFFGNWFPSVKIRANSASVRGKGSNKEGSPRSCISRGRRVGVLLHPLFSEKEGGVKPSST